MLLLSAHQEVPGAKARGARHYASAHPEVTVYTGPQSPRKAVTLRTLRAKYDKGQPITMVTAYDYPSAVHVSSGAATRGEGGEGAAARQCQQSSSRSPRLTHRLHISVATVSVCEQ
jgi:hypothetical protein